MTTPKTELEALEKTARQLAKRRKETPSTAHLLVAITHYSTAACDLLSERRIDRATLFAGLDHVAPDGDEGVRLLLDRTRQLAARSGADRPTAAHLLIALAGERRLAGHRLLVGTGVDMPRLRSAAMNVGLGLIGRRRVIGQAPSRAERPERREQHAETPPGPSGATPVPGPGRRPRGVAIPVVPAAPRSTPPRRPTPVRAFADTVPEAPMDEVVNRTSSTPPPARATPAPPSPRSPAPTPSRQRPAPTPSRALARRDEVTRFALDERRFPLLASIGHNLTLAAARGHLDPVVGRHREVQQSLDVLAKRHGNNPILVGAAGVGKTSVARAIAAHIAERKETAGLDDRIIVEVPLTELLAGTGVRGALAQRFGQLRAEVIQGGGRVVIFLDEIHQLFAGDLAEEIAGDLKLALARGELPCIGATTREEYVRAIEADAALVRRFSVVEVDEPSAEEATAILESQAERLAVHHGVRYGGTSLARAVAWSIRYVSGRALPDKAVAIADLAGARTRRRGGDEVTEAAVAEVVSEMTEVPMSRLLETDGDRMQRMEELLANRVVGHEDAMHRIARILRRNAAGLSGGRPLGTFLLLGPTGVGKTETAKAVAEVLFHSEHAMTRIDLAEYGEAHAVARLIGAPPGYVGHEAGGQLTEAVRKRPYQVILLDEIEKAHPEVLMTFLGLFDEGRLTDGRGRTIDFANTVILLTSNIGAREAASPGKRRVGFGNRDSGAEQRQSREAAVIDAARATLAPELYNRLDEVLVFSPLTREDVRAIARRLLAGLGSRLERQRGVHLQVSDEVVEVLLDAGGFEAALGARPLKRVMARLIEARLADRLLAGDLGVGDTALVEVEDDEIVVDVLDATSAAE